MEKMVKELKKLMNFKPTTETGDTVLVVGKGEKSSEPDILFYAHVSDIERDTSRRDEWWHVYLQILSVPVQKVTWTLRTSQMCGEEIFTMGGAPRFIKAVDFGVKPPVEPLKKKEKGEGKVLTFKR
ncbi:MAG: hypothetical protein M0O96_08455 [Desulforhopalus sp.]|nr:hypothetical protein [Desulforhopalus sp.]